MGADPSWLVAGLLVGVDGRLVVVCTLSFVLGLVVIVIWGALGCWLSIGLSVVRCKKISVAVQRDSYALDILFRRGLCISLSISLLPAVKCPMQGH